MICENCGADYRMKDSHCPFCHSENPVLAEIRKERTLSGYDEEAQKMQETVPRTAVRKWTGLMLAVCGVVAGMALVTGILVAAWGTIRAKLDYRAHLLRERELEELFAGQAIEQICQTLSRDMDARDYPKFQEVWEVYGSYDAYRRSLESLEQYREEFRRETYDEPTMRAEAEQWACLLIGHAGDTARLCRMYGSDRVIQGNEALFSAYREEITDDLREMGITGELLEWVSMGPKDLREDSRFRQAVDAIVDAYAEAFYAR